MVGPFGPIPVSPVPLWTIMAQDNSLPLSNRLESPQLEMRRRAIREVFESRSVPSGSIVAVLRLVADRDDQVRGWACESLDRFVRIALVGHRGADRRECGADHDDRQDDGR